jgi:hypothetical protein
MIEIFPNEFGFLSSQRPGPPYEGGGERGDDHVRERVHQETARVRDYDPAISCH